LNKRTVTPKPGPIKKPIWNEYAVCLLFGLVLQRFGLAVDFDSYKDTAEFIAFCAAFDALMGAKPADQKGRGGTYYKIKETAFACLHKTRYWGPDLSREIARNLYCALKVGFVRREDMPGIQTTKRGHKQQP
jgi:hypothetical protein